MARVTKKSEVGESLFQQETVKCALPLNFSTRVYSNFILKVKHLTVQSETKEPQKPLLCGFCSKHLYKIKC